MIQRLMTIRGLAGMICAGVCFTVAQAWVQATWWGNRPQITLDAIEGSDCSWGIVRTPWRNLYLPTIEEPPSRSHGEAVRWFGKPHQWADVYGWPAESMALFYNDSKGSSVGVGIPLPGNRPDQGTGYAIRNGLPIFPLLGFAVNTLVYGLAWLLVSEAWFASRRMMRLHAGGCHACGYPVRGLATCPECGIDQSARHNSHARAITGEDTGWARAATDRPMLGGERET